MTDQQNGPTEDESQVVEFEAKWEVNQYSQPALVNQIAMTPGPGTMFGPDSVYYLLMGHVMPPNGPMPIDEDGKLRLDVTPIGHFALTEKRVRELHHILGKIIQDMDQ